MRTTKKLFIAFSLLLSGIFIIESCSSQKEAKSTPESRYRIIVSSDIGGTDPDDFQSMIHLFLYADTIDLEGIISSPFGLGGKKNILDVIDQYEKDYPNLVSYSGNYPTADSLSSISKQGATAVADYTGVGSPTEGSEWIITCARREDPRPLYVLVWGGIEDLAQALHDAPDILPKLRVYYIGGPNKKWTPDAYQYIVDSFPNLWIIESNATYRGWFTGGNQSDEWSNTSFPEKYIAGRGAMANFFMTQLEGTIKMGDTPSLAWLLNSPNPEDPTQPCWGGQYVRAWERPFYLFDRMPTENDSIQEFAIMELALPINGKLPEQPEAFLKVDNQALRGYFAPDNTLRFRYSPKADGLFKFEIESNVTELNGSTGVVSVFIPAPEIATQVSDKYPNWWTDIPSPDYIEGNHIGAKTVSRWREEFLQDFARRMDRCRIPKE
ncbi:DUF1593 domain-containing protein [Mangrovibacterium sp.]|uniref:DUF1593 domain-containing protein n=1 Tax=Mangrovibacterium sp. TaxID=1961364 RepID=UPI003563C5E5